MKIDKFLRENGACKEGKAFVRKHGLKRAGALARDAHILSEQRSWYDWLVRKLCLAKLSGCWCKQYDYRPTYRTIASRLRSVGP